MLKSLTISNFALVEHAFLEFDTGLTVISGETGAGKSILIDALGCVLGERTSTESIRTGKEFLRVDAVFEIHGNYSAIDILDELAIPVEDDYKVIITRRFTATGKNTALINGCQVTVSTLKKVAEALIDICGQHESQSLLRPDTYILQLDSFAEAIIEKLNTYKKTYHEWHEILDNLAEAEKKAQERERRLDMLAWQTDEIAAACLKPEEDIELEQHIRLLANSEKIVSAVNTSFSLLNGNGEERGGIVSQLSEVKKALEQAVRFDERLNRQLQIITESIYQLQEVEHELSNYFQEMEFEPALLEKLQARMDTIYKLKKKYGFTIAEILDYYKRACEELIDLQNFDTTIASLKKKYIEIEDFLMKLAEELDRLRRDSGAELANLVTGHLKDLGMPGAKFSVDIYQVQGFNARGSNQVIFQFSANRGEEPRPLNKIASGGEVSRIALAMKAVLSSRDEIGTMIFDELDAGIGGKTAQMVAEKIAIISLTKQVLCITHLPQVAAVADSHYYIEKIEEGARTKTVVRKLDQTGRTYEVARMISGDQSQDSLKHAESMLKDAKTKKEIWKNKAQA